MLNNNAMKKLVFTLLAALAITNTAISQHLQIHETNEGYCRQNYHSVLTPEGDIILDEDLFDCDNNDIGIKFLKYNREGSLIDSLFVDDIEINSYGIFERNPLSDNESIYMFVSRNADDGLYYYNAMYLSDDIDITSRISVPLAMEVEMNYRRYRLDDDGSIMMSWQNASKDTCRYARLNMSGEVLSVSSVPMRSSYWIPVECPWFKISDEPYRLGHMMYYDSLGINSHILVNVFDVELNLVDTREIKQIGVKPVWGDLHTSAVEMGNGCFAIMSNIKKQMTPTGHARRGVAKYNACFEQQSYHIIDPVASWSVPQPMSVDKIDGGVYVVWNEKDVGIPFKTHVRYLNSNLEEVWDKVCIKNVNDINVVETSHPFENGGAVLTGFMGAGDYYNSRVYLNIIDSDYDSTNGQLCNENPFVCYPNPSSGVINLSFAENTECQLVEIYAIDGRLLQSQSSDFERVDMSGLEPGIYIIKVRLADGREYAERVVRE